MKPPKDSLSPHEAPAQLDHCSLLAALLVTLPGLHQGEGGLFGNHLPLLPEDLHKTVLALLEERRISM